MLAQEPEQREEAALAEDREQEGRDREVGLVEQRRERRLTAGGREAELVAAQARAAREDLDVARLVGGLDREELHHLAKVRMEPARKRAGTSSAAVSFSIRYVMT